MMTGPSASVTKNGAVDLFPLNSRGIIHTPCWVSWVLLYAVRTVVDFSRIFGLGYQSAVRFCRYIRRYSHRGRRFPELQCLTLLEALYVGCRLVVA